MWTGTLVLELLLGDVHSLKEKRSVVRPVVAELRRRFAVSAAEAGHLDLHRRALVGVAVVAADRAHCVEVIDRCERLVTGRPEVEVLSARSRFIAPDDLEDDLHDDLHGDRRGAPSGDPARGPGRAPGDDPAHHLPAAAGEVTTTTGGCHG